MFKLMNIFYLIRHGENTANITKEFSYKLVDYSLTEKGILNANCSITEMKAELDDGRIVGELIMWAYHGHLHGEAAKLVAGHPKFE